MAVIILDPGEQFEHQHATPSTTQLVEGEGHVTYGDNSRRMTPGEIVEIPANTPHVITNVGASPLRLHCLHKPA